MAASSKGKVCVTGAGGYLGSWIVQLLLSKNYVVHGTVRQPEGYESLENRHWLKVDVRDVAEALLLVYQNPEAHLLVTCRRNSRQLCGELSKGRNVGLVSQLGHHGCCIL